MQKENASIRFVDKSKAHPDRLRKLLSKGSLNFCVVAIEHGQKIAKRRWSVLIDTHFPGYGSAHDTPSCIQNINQKWKKFQMIYSV